MPKEPNNSKGGDAAGPTKIKIIEVRRALTDVATADEDELAALLAAVEPPLGRGTVAAYLQMRRVLQGPLGPYLLDGAPRGPELESVAIRDALTDPAVRPLVVRRGAAEGGEGAQARAAGRVRAIDAEGRDIAVAAEEPIGIVGYAFDPPMHGAGVVAALAGGGRLGLDVYETSGAFSAPLLAAQLGGLLANPDDTEATSADTGATSDDTDKDKPGAEAASDIPIAPRLKNRGFWLWLGAGKAADVQRASAAAARHAFSGAAAALVAALLARRRAYAALTARAPQPAEAAPPGPTWRPPAVAEALAYVLGLLARTEAVAPTPWVYDLSPVYDVYRSGAMLVYLCALTEGRGAPRIDDYVDTAAIRAAKDRKLAELTRRAVEATARARLYTLIVEDKFGSARRTAVLDGLRAAAGARARGAPGGALAPVAAAIQIDNPEAVLALLTKREREVVETEYANRRRAWEEEFNNRCRHVALARRLRTAATAADALAALRALEAYIEPAAQGRAQDAQSRAASDHWLHCRSCKSRALCPHVRERVALEAAGAPYETIRTRLLRYAVRVPREGSDPEAYFCRVCSEKLGEATEEVGAAERLGRFGDLDAPYRTKIWAEAVRAAPHVRFPAPVDDRQFARAAAEAIYPLLMGAEEALLKTGRRRRRADGAEEEEADPRTQLYIVLFVYAYILDLVQTTAAQRGREVGFEGVKLGAKPSAYAERMLALVAAEHGGLLARIEDVTPEYVRARFTEAYRLVRGEGAASPGALSADPEAELAVQTTTIDPVYRYAVAVARVAGDLPIARAEGPAAARREFETALGAPLPAIVRQARAALKDPALAALYLRRTGAEVPPGAALEYHLKDPRVNLYARLYEPAFAAEAAAVGAFRRLAAAAGGKRRNDERRNDERRDKDPHRNKNLQRQEPVLEERGCYFESYRLFAEYTTRLTSAESRRAYDAELAAHRRGEAALAARRAARAIKTYYDFGMKPVDSTFPTVALTSIYDEGGIRHDWSANVTYVFGPADSTENGPADSTENGAAKATDGAATDKTANAKEVLVTGGPKGAAAARSAGKLVGLVLRDLQCPVCGVRASATAALDAAATTRAVAAASELASFYVYYESRCPLGELHELDAESKCRKCGLTAELIRAGLAPTAVKSKAAREYYEAHRAAFDRDRAEIGALPPPEAARAEAPPALAPLPPEDYSAVVRAAELAGTTPAALEAIGDTAGRDYADVVEGRGVPPPPEAASDPRIYAADAEVRLFLADYGALRNAGRAARPAPFALELLEAAKVPKHEYALLPELFPLLGEEYHAQFAAARATLPPAEVYRFVIQSLCRLAVRVATPGAAVAPPGVAVATPRLAEPPWLRPLGEAFAARELGLILRGQKLLSKPGNFNWAIFETDDEGAEIPEQIGDVGEDAVEPEGEEARPDPFSGENMDYDTSEANPNNEPE